VSGTDGRTQRRNTSWGLRPQTPGIYRIDANPSKVILSAGAQFSPNPSLVLAPESALSLLPSRGLSSAPVASSVFGKEILCKGGTKKYLTFAALSDMLHNGLLGTMLLAVDCTITSGYAVIQDLSSLAVRRAEAVQNRRFGWVQVSYPENCLGRPLGPLA